MSSNRTNVSNIYCFFSVRHTTVFISEDNFRIFNIFQGTPKSQLEKDNLICKLCHTVDCPDDIWGINLRLWGYKLNFSVLNHFALYNKQSSPWNTYQLKIFVIESLQNRGYTVLPSLQHVEAKKNTWLEDFIFLFPNILISKLLFVD